MSNLVVRLAVTLAVALFATVGCSDGDPYGDTNIVAGEVNGTGTLGLAAQGRPVKEIMVYFHGSDQTAAVIQDSAKHKEFFAPFLRDGFAVVAADAGGNAFGSPTSRQDYRNLIHAAEQKYHAKVTAYVAESMGALAALALLGEDHAHQIKGMVGISPLMGIPPYIRTTTFIADPWGGNIPDAADPLSWPTDTFAGDAFRLYQAKRDRVLPKGATAADFAARFGGVATVDIVECAGDHVDRSCYQGSDAKQWLAGFG